MEDYSSEPSRFAKNLQFWRERSDSNQAKEDKPGTAITKNQTKQSESKEPNSDSVRHVKEDTEQYDTHNQDSKRPRTDPFPPEKGDQLVATATKDQTKKSKIQDLQFKTDSIQLNKEDKPVAASAANNQSKTQGQQYMETQTDLIQLVEEVPAQAPPDESYNDILVIGRTGRGKSSTVDKLVAATTNNQTEQRRTREQKSKKPEIDSNEVIQLSQDELQYKNLKVEMVMSEPKWEAEEKNNTETRLQNIVHSRNSKKETHIQINELRARTEGDKSSKSYQLLENCETKIRVLDPPGFYSPELSKESTSTLNSNFTVFQQIIRVQAIKGLNFSQVLYFLPQNGPLERSDRGLQEEIQKLAKYFGRSIFKHIVLIGTMPQHISENPDITLERKFPRDLLEQSQVCFHKTVVREFEQRNEDTTGLPIPPIIFIAMTNTCEEILAKVLSAQIESKDTRLGLEFNSDTCSKCGIEIGISRDNVMVCEYRKPGQIPWANATACDETWCHPNIMPIKTFKSIMLGLFKSICTCTRWKFTEDLCIHCKKRAGSLGCLQVNTEFDHKDAKTVTHTCTTAI